MLPLLLLSGCLFDRELYERRRAEILAAQVDDDSGCAPQAVWVDADGDGWGNDAYPDERCGDLAGWATRDGDCDDADAGVHPEAEELCATEADDDCDGATNEEGAADGVAAYADADGDGFGDPTVSATVCVVAGAWVADGTDCDDADLDVNPGAEEVCNTGKDEDCDAGTTCRLEGEVLVGGAEVTWYGETWDDYWVPARVGDLDGDGADDLAVPDHEGLHLLKDPGDGEWTLGEADLLTIALDSGTRRFRRTVGADFDGDGTQDVATSGFDDDLANSFVSLFRGGPTGVTTSDAAWVTWDGYGTRTRGFSMTTVDDINGDGLPELLFSDLATDGASTSGIFLMQPGTATVLEESLASVSFPVDTLSGYAVASGDLNGDRIPDIVLTAPSPTASAAYVFHGPLASSVLSAEDADVTIADGPEGLLGVTYLFEPVLDSNGDGDADLLLGARGAGRAYLWEGPLSSFLTLEGANGTFVGDTGSLVGWTVAHAEADGDGREDIVLSVPEVTDDGGALVYYGPANGIYDAASADLKVVTDTESGFYAMSPGDMDRDGIDELAFAAADTAMMTVFRGQSW